MTTPSTLVQLTLEASRSTATEAELLAAGERGRRAGELAYSSGKGQRCPFRLGTLQAHVWLRWYVYARLSAAGLE